MIAIYEGKIGGGKTFLAVCRILAHLAKGGTVFTNVELRLEGVASWLKHHHGLEFDSDSVRFLNEDESWDFHKYLKAGSDLNTLCVIDEAHLWFNARDHAVTAATKRELITFLSQSRKLKVDVIFIVQAAENLDAQFRRLAQEIWRMKDLQRFRVPLLGIAYPWPHTMAFRLDNGNMQVMEKKLLRRTQDIFEAYNTNALLRPVEFAGEVQGRRELKRVAQDKPALLSWLKSVQIWQPSSRTLAICCFVSVILVRVAHG
jgi:zona occludens toxin (predicted ATPase)